MSNSFQSQQPPCLPTSKQTTELGHSCQNNSVVNEVVLERIDKKLHWENCVPKCSSLHCFKVVLKSGGRLDASFWEICKIGTFRRLWHEVNNYCFVIK